MKSFEHDRARSARLRDFAWGGFFDECPSLSVCSPNGTLLRVAGDIGIRIREPLAEGGQAESWVFLDKEIGTVNTSKVAERAKRAKDLLDAHMIGIDEKNTIPESLTEYQWSCLSLASSLEPFIPPLSNFDGWALCCAEEDQPSSLLHDFAETFIDVSFDDWDDVFAVPQPLLDMPGRDLSAGKRGRPRKRDAAKDVYSRLFPHGHKIKGLTLKEALAAVSREAPGPMSEETLKRAIGLRN